MPALAAEDVESAGEIFFFTAESFVTLGFFTTDAFLVAAGECLTPRGKIIKWFRQSIKKFRKPFALRSIHRLNTGNECINEAVKLPGENIAHSTKTTLAKLIQSNLLAMSCHTISLKKIFCVKNLRADREFWRHALILLTRPAYYFSSISSNLA